VVTETDPPSDVAGMTNVVLDSRGHLVHFQQTRTEVARDPLATTMPDWSGLFAQAGLDPAQFGRTESSVIPPVPHDNRFIWRKNQSPTPDQLRIVGAALAGRPVYFDVATVGATSNERRNWFLPSRRPWTELLLAGVVVGAFAASVVLARRNLRRRQSDPRGANTLSAIVVCGTTLWTLLAAHHVPILSEEWRLVELTLVSALGWAGLSWVMYTGLEPQVRRWWPTTLSAWTRFVSGHAHDRIVGRDVLIGFLAGIAVDALLILRFALARRAAVNLEPYNTSFDPRARTLAARITNKSQRDRRCAR
jgi:hypothetical protein